MLCFVTLALCTCACKNQELVVNLPCLELIIRNRVAMGDVMHMRSDVKASRAHQL
jgi:hypothetical protein